MVDIFEKLKWFQITFVSSCAKSLIVKLAKRGTISRHLFADSVLLLVATRGNLRLPDFNLGQALNSCKILLPYFSRVAVIPPANK